MGLFCKFLPTWVVLHTPTLAPEGASCRTTATAQLVARARHVREQVQHQPGLSGRRGSDAHSTCWAGCRGLLKRQRRGDPPHAASENRGDPAAGSPQQDPPGPPRFCSGIHCKTQAMIQPQALRSPSQPARPGRRRRRDGGTLGGCPRVGGAANAEGKCASLPGWLWYRLG
jgi:hypothetical protein